MSEPTISAYIQCHSHKAALYHALLSFRKHYPTEQVTLVSDCGEDFARFGEYFNLMYYRSALNCDPRAGLGQAGAAEYLKRIYDHCAKVSSDFVVILEEDVTTRRRIKQFPITPCAGPRCNGFTDRLNRYLQQLHGTTQDYGYGMCGGSIFDRRVFVQCYDRHNLDLGFLSTLDEGVIQYGDVAVTVMFLVNGHSYGVWDEVSETFHPIEHMRIFRDSAFDHHDKRRYADSFDESLLEGSFRDPGPER